MNANLKQAIEEQQDRLYHLRSLLQCVQLAAENADRIDDLESTLTGLVALADSIYLAIEPGELNNRVKEISDEATRAREREEAYRQREEEARGDEMIPPAPSSVN